MAAHHPERDRAADDGSDPADPDSGSRSLAPTRGLLLAVVLSLMFWAVVGLAAWPALR